MSVDILGQKTLPFCAACGHAVVTKHLSKAVAELNLDPMDVIVVSDIGCVSLIDSLLDCHTVHGLHGRAVALAMGIRFGIGEGKKIIAVQGDGGATIGLQHLLEAARRNVDITLIVQNNLVYGMTGGQISGLSPTGFKQDAASPGESVPPYDVCGLAHCAGASFVAREFVGRDSVELWTEALTTEGFSMIEIVEMCAAHGIKKLKQLQAAAEYPATTLRRDRLYRPTRPRVTASLFEELKPVPARVAATIREPIGIIVAGSAGEGVQSAGELLATAGVTAGLHATKKGEYPISVGTGFSVAEVILSPNEIRYTAIDRPHTVIAVSEKGLGHVSHRIGDDTNLVIDETLRDQIGTRNHTEGAFRKNAGPKGAALAAIAYWLSTTGVLPPESLLQTIRGHRHEGRLQQAIDSSVDIQ